MGMTRYKRNNQEGSISKRGSRYRAQTIPVKGKRASRSFKTKAEAQEWLRSMQTKLDRGFDYQGSKVSLGEYLTQWLEAAKAYLRDMTAIHYQQVIRSHILPGIGSVRLADLTLFRLERFYSELVQAGVGIRTVRIVHSILHISLGKAVHYGLLMTNPTQGAALPRYQHAEMRVLDESQVVQFLVAAHGSHYEALYYLAINTGMREGELFGLKWSDLHWDMGVLYVQRQVQSIPGKGKIFTEPKTVAGRRPLKLGEGVLQKLRIHKEQQAFQKALAVNKWKENDLVFPTRIGTPEDPGNLRKDFLRVLDMAGLPHIRFHDLRHTSASIQLNRGVPILVVSKRLGHAKPSTTLNVYSHLYMESQDEPARIMDEILTPVLVTLPKVQEVKKNSPGC
jgi:integrase